MYVYIVAVEVVVVVLALRRAVLGLREAGQGK